jgi:hypothetical protein
MSQLVEMGQNGAEKALTTKTHSGKDATGDEGIQ